MEEGEEGDGGQCLEYIIWSLSVSRSVFASSKFHSLRLCCFEACQWYKLGDFSSLLLSHFLEIPSQKQE